MENEFKTCSKSEKNSVHSKLINKYKSIEESKFKEKYDLDKSIYIYSFKS